MSSLHDDCLNFGLRVVFIDGFIVGMSMSMSMIRSRQRGEDTCAFVLDADLTRTPEHVIGQVSTRTQGTDM